MAIDYEQLKNWRFEERTDRYDLRDSIIYALTLGYGDTPSDTNDLRYIYEYDTLAVPTLLATIGAPGAWATDPELGINWVKLLHGEHRITFHAPVPAKASVISQTRVTHVIDKGAEKGALVVTTRDIFNAEGRQPLATVEHVSFLRADGGFGRSDEPLLALPATPTTPPDATLLVRSTPQSAALYRLNGDLNPIHILPSMAEKAGFDRPILHGLCTYGMAARALIKHCCPTDPGRLGSLSVRFSSPFFPGETLRVEIWKMDNRVQFRALAHERNVVVLSHGVAGLREVA